MAQGIWTPGGSFDRQPTGLVEIDRTNAFGRAVVNGTYGRLPYTALSRPTNNVTAGCYQEPSAIRFDTTSGHRFSLGKTQPTGSFTVLARVKKTTASNFFSIFDNKQVGDWGSSAGFNLNIRSDGGVLFKVGTSESYTVTNHFGDAGYHTIAAVFSAGASQKIYVDGNEVTYFFTSAASSYVQAASELVVGSYYDYGPERSASGEIEYAILLAGALPTSVHRQFFANPWHLFRDDTSDILIFDMGAGGGAGSHTLTGANSTQSNTGTTAAIAQAHALAGANSVQANTGGTGSIGSDITLAGAAGSTANVGGVGAIGQVHVLVGAASAQANGAGTGTITQVHALAGANATQVNVGSTAALGETVITLAGSAGSSANTGSAGAITQAHVLVGAASVQDNVAAASAIVQAHVLAGANAVQGNLGSVGAITAFDFSTAASPYVAFVPYTNHIAFVPAVSNTALRGL